DAADVVQETLLAAFRRADGYRGDASVRTWLHRILVNACIDRIRRENRHRTVPLPEAEPRERGADVASDVVTRLSVDAALAELPAHQRVAVVLVDVHGWPVEEVAQVLEVPVGTVKSRSARARLRLGALLGQGRRGGRCPPEPTAPRGPPSCWPTSAGAGSAPGARPRGGRRRPGTPTPRPCSPASPRPGPSSPGWPTPRFPRGTRPGGTPPWPRRPPPARAGGPGAGGCGRRSSRRPCSRPPSSWGCCGDRARGSRARWTGWTWWRRASPSAATSTSATSPARAAGPPACAPSPRPAWIRRPRCWAAATSSPVGGTGYSCCSRAGRGGACTSWSSRPAADRTAGCCSRRARSAGEPAHVADGSLCGGMPVAGKVLHGL